MARCCTSTFDFDYVTRYFGKDQGIYKPMVLGSFGTGIVIKLGGGAQGTLKVGDRVALEPGIFCDKCRVCVAGKTNLCPDIRYLGTAGQDGVLTRFINHPVNFTHKLKGVSLDVGTLSTQIATCIHGYRRSGITKKSKVLIMGTSLMGLLAIMIFKHLGVGSIFVAETNNYRLKMAREVGADHVIKMASIYSPEYPEYLTEIIDSIQSGKPDIVIDTMGTSTSFENSFSLTRSGGTLALMNLMSRPISARFHHATLREIDLVGAFSYTHSSFMEAIKLLSNEEIPIKKITPVRIPLERGLDAFSHGKASGGENIFIIVSSYRDKDDVTDTPIPTSTDERTAGVPDLNKPLSQTKEPSKNGEGKLPSTSTAPETQKNITEIKGETSSTTQRTEELETATPTLTGTDERTAGVPDLKPPSQTKEPSKNGEGKLPSTSTAPETKKNITETKGETSSTTQRTEELETANPTLTSTDERTAGVPDLKPPSQTKETPKPKEPTKNEKLSYTTNIAPEKEKHGKEVKEESTLRTEELAKQDKDDVHSTSSTNEKKDNLQQTAEPNKKISEVIPSSKKENEQDKKSTTAIEETKQHEVKLSSTSTVPEKEKNKEMPSSMQRTEEQAKQDKEKEYSTSSTDEKKGDLKKKTEPNKKDISEITLNSTKENEQDKKSTTAIKETKQDVPINKEAKDTKEGKGTKEEKETKKDELSKEEDKHPKKN